MRLDQETYADAASYGQTGTAAKQSFMSPLSQADKNLSVLEESISRLATRLVGPSQAGEGAGATTSAPPAMGLFGSIEEQGRTMSEKVDRCHRLLARIESSLP